MKRFSSLRTLCAVSILVFGLSGCALSQISKEVPSFFSQEVNLKAINYTAVDMLLQQARHGLATGSKVIVTTISGVDDVEQSSPLGRRIAEQATTRLIQLGYQIPEIKYRGEVNIQDGSEGLGSEGEYALTRDSKRVAGAQTANALLTGTYAVTNSEVLVNVRFVRVYDGTIIAAHDYAIPLNRDIRALLGQGQTGGGFFSDGSGFN